MASKQENVVKVASGDAMDQYHKYLEENYVGGCERFFSPTGFLDKFQRAVEVKSQVVRNHVFVKTVDDAASKLEVAIANGSDVFDLTAEPGTGKTSVLPFRFPSKKVIVALPTPFDAWNAYGMATGSCSLRLKGLRLGNQGSNVIYTDSYLAACALLANSIDYDILIVDECDSDRGVTKFLAEVKTVGKLLIRMSASHGRTKAGLSSSFRVTDSKTMPDCRDGLLPVAEFVKTNHSNRSLVLAPDAQVAAELSGLIKGSVLLTVSTNLGVMAKQVGDQKSTAIYVSDDTCGRALNLNIDTLFDSQLVTEYATMRSLTPAELYQRMGRVGRNKEGWYFSPGLSVVDKKTNDYDVVRHNVVRALANVQQLGDERLHLTYQEAEKLMCSPIEPYEQQMRVKANDAAVSSSSSSSGRSSRRSFASVKSDNSYSAPSPGDLVKTIVPPPWLAYYGGFSSKVGGSGKAQLVDTFVVSNARGQKALLRRRSSSSSGEDKVSDSGQLTLRGYRRKDLALRSHDTHHLPVVFEAPYSLNRSVPVKQGYKMELPQAPPVMDLTMLTYDLDWPSLIRDRLSRGGDLPTVVPPGSWRHTSAGGLGTDWFRRLDDVSVRDNTFDDEEFEIVCRAWNKLVGQAWVKASPGLSNVRDAHRLEYCVRYFQSFFLLSSVG